MGRCKPNGSEKGNFRMDMFRDIALLVVAVTTFWVYMGLKTRLEFLEHEVRWLRKELDSLKPAEAGSAYD